MNRDHIGLEPAFLLQVEVGDAEVDDLGLAGKRRIVPILGGRAEGEGLKGKIMLGGTDVQWIRPDGVTEIDASYSIDFGNGNFALLTDKGFRRQDGDEIYFRGAIQFTTQAEALGVLTRSVYVSAGEKIDTGVRIRIYRVT